VYILLLNSYILGAQICTHCCNINKSRRGGATFYVHPIFTATIVSSNVALVKMRTNFSTVIVYLYLFDVS